MNVGIVVHCAIQINSGKQSTQMKNLNKSTDMLLKYHSSYPYRW